jgi:GDP-4-dehydro-6-deoxy-D-mannose reductase
MTHNTHPTTSLITGVNGFVGKHMASHLALHQRKVIGIDIQATSGLSAKDYSQVDIRDPDALSSICEVTRPDEIIHLAAISHPVQFSNDQYPSFQINVLGTVALLDAIRSKCPRAKVLMVGTSKQYKNRNDGTSISEQTRLDPNDFYGISKYFSEMIGSRYVLTYDIDIRFTRSFNHTGPWQSPQFVCSDWARQLALIETGNAPPQILVGNIDEVIDFSDVRDVVDAYRLILEKGKKGEAYNVCSGKGISLKYILDYLLAKSSLPVSIVAKQNNVGTQTQNKGTVGNNRKIMEATGWMPRTPIEKTLDDLFLWWLAEIKQKSGKAGGA